MWICFLWWLIHFLKRVCVCVALPHAEKLKILLLYMWVNSAHVHTFLSSSRRSNTRQTGRIKDRKKANQKRKMKTVMFYKIIEGFGRCPSVHPFTVRQNGRAGWHACYLLTHLRLHCVCVSISSSGLFVPASVHGVNQRYQNLAKKIQWFHVVGETGCEVSANAQQTACFRDTRICAVWAVK